MTRTKTRRSQADHLPRSLGSIMRDPTITEPVPLVRGLLMQMSTLLFYAREKVGKTTFIVWLMKKLALGEPIFGQQSKPQTVLYASLEEGVHLVKMRMKELKVPGNAPIHVLSAVRHGSKAPLDVLEAAIIETGATVVVIDSLSAYTVGSVKGNSPEGWNEALYPLTRLASKHLCSLVIIHHANKGKGADFRGSTAIGAAVDTIANMSIPAKSEPNVRCIRWSGRYGAGDLLTARHAATGNYEMIDGDSLPPEIGRGQVTDETLVRRILEARKVEGGATKDMLRKAGGVKATRADAVIERLREDGRLRKRTVKGGFRYMNAA